MAERGLGLENLSYGQLSAMFPDGSDDPGVAELLRRKRIDALNPPEPEYYTDPRGGVTYGKGVKLTDEQRRWMCVGDTCDHLVHESDLAKGWYKEDEVK